MFTLSSRKCLNITNFNSRKIWLYRSLRPLEKGSSPGITLILPSGCIKYPHQYCLRYHDQILKMGCMDVRVSFSCSREVVSRNLDGDVLLDMMMTTTAPKKLAIIDTFKASHRGDIICRYHRSGVTSHVCNYPRRCRVTPTPVVPTIFSSKLGIRSLYTYLRKLSPC